MAIAISRSFFFFRLSLLYFLCFVYHFCLSSLVFPFFLFPFRVSPSFIFILFSLCVLFVHPFIFNLLIIFEVFCFSICVFFSSFTPSFPYIPYYLIPPLPRYHRPLSFLCALFFLQSPLSSFPIPPYPPSHFFPHPAFFPPLSPILSTPMPFHFPPPHLSLPLPTPFPPLPTPLHKILPLRSPPPPLLFFPPLPFPPPNPYTPASSSSHPNLTPPSSSDPSLILIASPYVTRKARTLSPDEGRRGS